MKLRVSDPDCPPDLVGLIVLSVAGRRFSPAAKAFVAADSKDEVVIPLVRPEGYPGVAQCQVLDVPGDEGVFAYLCDKDGTPRRAIEYVVDPGVGTYAASLSPVR